MNFSRFDLLSIPPSVHGAIDFTELEHAGLNPDDVLDFSVNSNPFGPSPLIRQALEKTPLDRYPDRECLALRRALAEHLGVSPEQIIVGNGTAELIWLSAFAFLKAGDPVLILGPTFGEYERSVRLVSANPIYLNAHSSNGFTIDVTETSRLLSLTHYRAVYVCNPNNPTGQFLAPETLFNWAEEYPNTLFVIDEAYISFMPDQRSVASRLRPNLLVLRSMTKDYALAGLRLGYAVGEQRLVQALMAVRPAWNVNSFAQTAGLAALADEAYYQSTLNQLREEKSFFVNGLVELGYFPVPSHTHFFLVKVSNAAHLKRELLPQGILVRDCTSFGLPEHIRIATRTRDQNLRLLDCLQTHRYQ